MTKLTRIDDSLIGSKFKPGMRFRFQLAIPCVETEGFAMLIEHDGPNEENINSMLKLADEGKAPYCVSIGVFSSELLMPDGSERNMRMNNYDYFDRKYGDFLVYELIPYIKAKYNINFSESADMHFVSGGSSGGISAFVIAWFHPDYFHRVFMCAPSFIALGRGNELPYLIRKYETKPFRIFEEYYENEINDYSGWIRSIDEQTRESLIFANYDFKYKFFQGESHCERYHDENTAYERNEWIWHDWKDTPITAPGNSPRVDSIVPFESKWEKCESFPQIEKETCEKLCNSYENIVLSNDKMAWYAANKDDDNIYMFVRDENLSLNRKITHAMLHTIPHQKIKGTIDMAVDKTDRLFVLTEIGIQCVRTYGAVDVILDLPDNSNAQRIAITDALYVQTENGIYKRELCKEHITESEEKRQQTNYYD